MCGLRIEMAISSTVGDYLEASGFWDTVLQMKLMVLIFVRAHSENITLSMLSL